MSPTAPSRVGTLGVVLLTLILAVLGAILWSLDRFHREMRELTGAIRELGQTPGAVVLPAAAERPPIGGGVVLSNVEPRTLNRWTSNEAVIRQVCNFVHDGLFSLDPDLQIRPGLATRWEVSPDKLHYTFWLREDVRFSDGTPFTAADVVYTLELIQDPAVRSEHCKDEYSDIVDVVAEGPHRVVFRYRVPYWRGIYALGEGLRVYSAAWVRKEIERLAAADPARFPPGSYSLEPGQPGFGAIFNEILAPSVGTGPYRYDPAKSWVHGQQITLYRSPSSWWLRAYPGKWNLAFLRWRFIRDDVVLWEEVRRKAVDVRAVYPDKWYDSFQHDASITDAFDFYQYDHVSLGQSVVFWNCRRPLFADKRVRQALLHLIDRKTMLEVFDKGVGSYATCMFKPIYPEYSHDLVPRLLDLAKAKALLAQAGWQDTNGDGVLDREGVDFRFTLRVPQGREEYVRWGQLWQGDMRKAGVHMELEVMEWGSFIAAYNDHDFDALSLYNSHNDPWIEPYEEYLSTRTGKGELNHSGWSLKEVDELLETARSEFDRSKRIEIFHRFNHIRDEYQPEALLLHPRACVVVHKRFRNVKVTPAGLRYEDWYVAPADRLYDDQGVRNDTRR